MKVKQWMAMKLPGSERWPAWPGGVSGEISGADSAEKW